MWGPADCTHTNADYHATKNAKEVVGIMEDEDPVHIPKHHLQSYRARMSQAEELLNIMICFAKAHMLPSKPQ